MKPDVPVFSAESPRIAKRDKKAFINAKK